jgi:hypothetical protein
MPRTVFNHRFRIIIACLLAFCLSPTAAETRQWNARGDIGAYRLAYTFDATTVSSVTVFAEKRTRLKSGDLLIFFCHAQTDTPFYGASFSFCPHEYVDFINTDDHSPFPIRASPFRIG